jgi:hypothetical protein
MVSLFMRVRRDPVANQSTNPPKNAGAAVSGDAFALEKSIKGQSAAAVAAIPPGNTGPGRWQSKDNCYANLRWKTRSFTVKFTRLSRLIPSNQHGWNGVSRATRAGVARRKFLLAGPERRSNLQAGKQDHRP